MRLECKECELSYDIGNHQYATYYSARTRKRYKYEVHEMGAVYGAALSGKSNTGLQNISLLAGLAVMSSDKFHRYKNILAQCSLDAVDAHIKGNIAKVFEA